MSTASARYFKADMKDVALVARAFGSDGPNYLYPGSPPSSNWNSNANINARFSIYDFSP